MVIIGIMRNPKFIVDSHVWKVWIIDGGHEYLISSQKAQDLLRNNA